MVEKYRLVTFKPDGSQEECIITGNWLKPVQDAIGGYAEQIMVMFEGQIHEAYVNEDGRQQGLPSNVFASALSVNGHSIVGNLVIPIEEKTV